MTDLSSVSGISEPLLPSATTAPAAPAPLAADTLPDLRGHLPSLDGLRGWAIALVLLCHFLPEDGQPGSFAGRTVFFIGRAGWTGVDLFFVLSGFLITGILLDSKAGGTPRYFRTFYSRRTLRIFPLYYAVLAIVFLVIPLINPHAFDSPELRRVRHEQWWLWTYLTNIKTAMVVTKGSKAFYADWFELNPYWSLAVEEQFYLIWPAVVYFLSRRALVRVCVGVIVGAAVVRAAMTLHGLDHWAVYVFTPSRADSLAMGALIATLLREGGPAGRVLVAHSGKVAAVLGAVTLVWLNLRHRTLVYAVFNYFIVGAFFAFLLVKSLTAAPQSWIAWPFRARVMRMLGKYSYGLYVYHVVLLSTYDRWFPQSRLEAWYRSRLHLGHPAYAAAILTYIALATAITFAIAFVSWHLFERQFLRLKRHFEYRKPAAPVTPAADASATSSGGAAPALAS